MLHRTPEPEVMDARDQCRAYADADFSAPNAAFVTRFLETFPDVSEGHLLDLGCGPADIPILLCGHLPQIQITAFDASAAMLEIAQAHVVDAALEGRVTLVEGQLPLETPLGAFDGVLSNSLLHHLPDPSVLWQAIREHGKPGACVLVGDLRRPTSTEEVLRLVDMYSNPEPAVLRRDFHNSLRAAFTLEEVERQLSDAGLSGLRVEVISDRHLAVWGRL